MRSCPTWRPGFGLRTGKTSRPSVSTPVGARDSTRVFSRNDDLGLWRFDLSAPSARCFDVVLTAAPGWPAGRRSSSTPDPSRPLLLGTKIRMMHRDRVRNVDAEGLGSRMSPSEAATLLNVVPGGGCQSPYRRLVTLSHWATFRVSGG